HLASAPVRGRTGRRRTPSTALASRSLPCRSRYSAADDRHGCHTPRGTAAWPCRLLPSDQGLIGRQFAQKVSGEDACLNLDGTPIGHLVAKLRMPHLRTHPPFPRP